MGAIAELLISLDGQNWQSIKPGQTTQGSTKNYVKPGDSSKDFDDFANDLGAIKETLPSPRGPVRIIDMPDGGTAANYPKSTSTGDPTISISPSRGRGFGRFIKIRYNGGQANIYIPVRG